VSKLNDDSLIWFEITTGYLKEECADDEGWCFKSAVGSLLPPSFFSYPGPLRSSSSQIANITLPSHEQFIAEAFPSLSRRSSTDSFGPDTSRNRWDAIYFRRSSDNGSNNTAGRLYAAPVSQAQSQSDLVVLQSVVSKGYSDGFVTAQRFAGQDGSKLGFVGQYIKDSIASLGPSVVPPGNEEYYRQWFWQGLKDGETSMSNAFKASN
jgi:glucan 1,3-beta-glucosidase